jgi:hypothetical protein
VPVVLGRVPPGPERRRVLEMRLVASRPVAVRLWWARDGTQWQRTRSTGLLLDGSPRVVRLPVRGPLPVAIRLDAMPGSPATVYVSDARVLPASAVAGDTDRASATAAAVASRAAPPRP